MAAVCSNKLQLEIKKKQMIYHPLLFLFFFYVPWHSPPKFMRAWTIRDFDFAFFAIHTCFSPYICIIFFFCYYHGEGQGRKAERKRFSGRSIFCA